MLLGGPKDAYVDFQSAPADQGSDSVSCLDSLPGLLPVLLG